MDKQNDRAKTEKVSRIRIEQFKRDVKALKDAGFTQEEIGLKMEMEKPNFSRYLNERGKHQITDDILDRFYKAWIEQLKALPTKTADNYYTEHSSETGSQEEEARTYIVRNQKSQLIEILKKNNEGLLDSLGKMVETNQKLVGNNEKLVGNNEKLVSNNEKLVESNQKLVEIQLTFMGRRRENPNNGPIE